MRKIIILLFFLAGIASAHAQQHGDADSVSYKPIFKQVNDVRKTKPEYFFTVGTSMLMGCSDCNFTKEITFSAMTVHGITIGKYDRVGIGVGYDSYYFWQAMPLSGMVSLDIVGSKDKNALFLQVNGGWSKVWRSGYEEFGLTRIKGGAMLATQIGYRIKYHDAHVSFSIGTKFQQVTSWYEYPTYHYLVNGQVVAGSPSTRSVVEKLNRLQASLTVGWK